MWLIWALLAARIAYSILLVVVVRLECLLNGVDEFLYCIHSSFRFIFKYHINLNYQLAEYFHAGGRGGGG